jgi:hypothetical protein
MKTPEETIKALANTEFCTKCHKGIEGVTICHHDAARIQADALRWALGQFPHRNDYEFFKVVQTKATELEQP